MIADGKTYTCPRSLVVEHMLQEGRECNLITWPTTFIQSQEPRARIFMPVVEEATVESSLN